MTNKPRNSNTQKVIPRDLIATERVRLAFQLRQQRLTYEEIAERCGYANKGAARNAIMRELQRRVVPDVDEYRQQELEILDAIHQKVWPLVVREKGKPDLWAVDRLLALSTARRQLLNLDMTPDTVPASQVVVREIPNGYLGSVEESKS